MKLKTVRAIFFVAVLAILCIAFYESAGNVVRSTQIELQPKDTP